MRLARELWEILRRKKGCTLSRLYRSAQDDAQWLAYSEWATLGELAGARREAARSPLNRRLHTMLASSSERAYEPFGPVRSTHGVNFASAPVAILINFLEGIEEPETALASLAEAPGYISHILMHEVSKPESLTCLAHFDTAENAQHAADQLSEQPTLKDFKPAAELFAV